VRKEQMEAVIKAIENISKRFLTKEEREKKIEVLKLELINKCLKSTYLERRIQGIRDLNTLVKKITTPQYSYNMKTESKAFTADFLIDWMREHQVFQNMWDPRKTHLQIV
jgi:ubiquitin carboxyl-terminal hydrolase 34